MTDALAIKPYLGVARAPFLLLPPTLIAVGAAAAAWQGDAVSWVRTLVALVGLVALHAAVNALNEASDARTGIDDHTVRTPFSGGSGTVQAGGITSGNAFVFGLAMAAIGLVTGVYFLITVGWGVLPIMVAGAVLVLAYTKALARTGLGEIAAGLGLGWIPVVGTAYVQAGHLGAPAMLAGVPAFLMTFNLLLLNEFPDVEPDRAGGRRNLILVFGRPAAALVAAVAAIGVPVAIVFGVASGIFPSLALVAVLPSLLAISAVKWAFTDPAGPVPIPAMGGNVVWNLSTNTLLAVALAIATVWR